MYIDSNSLNFKDQDLIKTFDKGKIHLTLKGGDVIFLAPKTEILNEKKLETKGLEKIINPILKPENKKYMTYYISYGYSSSIYGDFE